MPTYPVLAACLLPTPVGVSYTVSDRLSVLYTVALAADGDPELEASPPETSVSWVLRHDGDTLACTDVLRASHSIIVRSVCASRLSDTVALLDIAQHGLNTIAALEVHAPGTTSTYHTTTGEGANTNHIWGVGLTATRGLVSREATVDDQARYRLMNVAPTTYAVSEVTRVGTGGASQFVNAVRIDSGRVLEVQTRRPNPGMVFRVITVSGDTVTLGALTTLPESGMGAGGPQTLLIPIDSGRWLCVDRGQGATGPENFIMLGVSGTTVTVLDWVRRPRASTLMRENGCYLPETGNLYLPGGGTGGSAAGSGTVAVYPVVGNVVQPLLQVDSVAGPYTGVKLGGLRRHREGVLLAFPEDQANNQLYPEVTQNHALLLQVAAQGGFSLGHI